MRYRLLVDETFECRIVHKRRNEGHDVEYVNDLAEFGNGTSDLVADEIAVVVRVQNLVSGLNLVRFDLDPIIRQRQESVVSVREVEAGCAFPEVVMDG